MVIWFVDCSVTDPQPVDVQDGVQGRRCHHRKWTWRLSGNYHWWCSKACRRTRGVRRGSQRRIGTIARIIIPSVDDFILVGIRVQRIWAASCNFLAIQQSVAIRILLQWIRAITDLIPIPASIPIGIRVQRIRLARDFIAISSSHRRQNRVQVDLCRSAKPPGHPAIHHGRNPLLLGSVPISASRWLVRPSPSVSC